MDDSQLATRIGLDASIHGPFQAIDILKLQTKFRAFYTNAVNGRVNERECERWFHYIRNPKIWRSIKNTVPGLMIREDEISQIPDHPLTQLHIVLKDCGYLEPAMTDDPLGTVRQREFEAVQDYLYHIFHPSVHRELHAFIDAMYDVQTRFPVELAQADCSVRVATGLGEVVDADETLLNAYNPHTAAYCDRVFNTLCAMWLIYRQNVDIPGYRAFRDAYKKYRSRQEGWNVK